MRSCRNPEKLDSRTGAIFTVHDATSKLGILSRAVMVAVTTASPAVVGCHRRWSVATGGSARDVTHRVYLTFSFKATFLFNCIIYLIFILVFCRLSVD